MDYLHNTMILKIGSILLIYKTRLILLSENLKCNKLGPGYLKGLVLLDRSLGDLQVFLKKFKNP